MQRAGSRFIMIFFSCSFFCIVSRVQVYSLTQRDFPTSPSQKRQVPYRSFPCSPPLPFPFPKNSAARAEICFLIREGVCLLAFPASSPFKVVLTCYGSRVFSNRFEQLVFPSWRLVSVTK